MSERSNPMSTRFRKAGLAALAVAAMGAPGGARAYTKTFSANSLIIPTQMEYQTDCGMVSAYGLVYTILYKNAALVAAGKKPVTVYWIIEPRKLSHHRCDTNTDALPDYSRYNDDDGCDFAIQSASGQPVALLDTTNAEQAPFNVYTSTYNTTSGQVTRSTTQNQVIDANKKVVKYSGGLWVIDATDRATVLSMFSDPLLTKYRDGGACTSLPVAAGASHYTMIHSARIGFTAPVARMMNDKPPLIALLAGKYVGILQGYLQNAGLDDIPGAGGNVTAHGVIYDVLTPLTDFISTPGLPLGALNMTDPSTGTNLYQVMWAPHWEEDNDTVPGPADGAPGDDKTGDGIWTHNGDDYKTNAFKNIATFSDDGFGVFLECASIASFEGSYKVGSQLCSSASQCTCLDSSATPACSPYGSTTAQVCPAGAVSMCNGCYQACPTGYTAKTSPCDQLRCVQDANPCPNGSTWRASDMSCWSCNTGNGWSLVSPLPADPAIPQCVKGTSYQNATSVTPNGTTPTAVTGSCPSAYTMTCQPLASSIELPGWDPVRFQITNRIMKNGLSSGSWGGSYTIPDCTDQYDTGTKYKHAPITGDCFDFHPTSGGPGNIFSQKGSFNFKGGIGHTSHWEPAALVGSVYRPATQQFATSFNSSNAARTGWDFVTARHKDDDPAKGMVVYLGGHTYDADPAGNRIVLNTMLNLGFSDEGTELSRSEPVGYVTWGKDTNGQPVVTAQTVFQGTYVQHLPPGPYQDWINYNPTAAGSWRFPYIDGHLRAYDLAKISTTGQDFASNALWDAGKLLPAPGARTLFTSVGGNANLGWKKIDVSYTETDPATCTRPSGTVDALGGPVCDLSMKLAQCNTAGVTTQQLLAGTSASSIASTLGMFVQQVRGWCAAHDKSSGAAIMQPTSTQCDNPTSKWQRNVAFLGGVDHSSPAVVGPSPYIGDAVASDGTATAWSKRPVVAYFGARDGMLHAVFVSGDPSFKAGGVTLPSGIRAGTELWAFLPPGQLCGLATNSAMVDANVNVMDVFGNFPRDVNGDGVFDLASATERPNGIREWRTILFATSGEGGGEMFALDVTNPLKPVVLWQLDGPGNSDDRFDLNGNGTFADTTDHMDKARPESYALKWFNSDDGTQGNHPWIPTPYDTTSATILDGIKTGRYDYHNLGYAYGTAIGTMWTGNAFQFAAFVTTSAADWATGTPLGYKGIEVFAVDVVTGQKLWQWENRYTRANAAGTVIADNGIPGRPALVDVDADGSVDRVYAGDLEGHLWELSAVDGRNLNYLPTSSNGARASFPLWGTPPMTAAGVDPATVTAFTPVGGTSLAQQPLTSPIGVGRFTAVPAPLEKYLLNRIAIAQGTMGVDWSIAPTQRGNVYVMPAFPEELTRLAAPISPSAKSPLGPLFSGVLLDEAVWSTTLDVGERVYGIPKIVGNDMFANTSYGSFSGDITSTLNDKGRSLKINAAGTTTVDTGNKRFGGVLVMGKDIVASSDTGLVRKTSTATPGGVPTRALNRFTPAAPKTWEQRPDGAPGFVQ